MFKSIAATLYPIRYCMSLLITAQIPQEKCLTTPRRSLPEQPPLPLLTMRGSMHHEKRKGAGVGFCSIVELVNQLTPYKLFVLSSCICYLTHLPMLKHQASLTLYRTYLQILSTPVNGSCTLATLSLLHDVALCATGTGVIKNLQEQARGQPQLGSKCFADDL